MSEAVARIVSIQAARKKTAEILQQSIASPEGKSEMEVRDEVLRRLASEPMFFEKGWYDPPPGGASVLFDSKPFDHLKYETIRDQAFWPSESRTFTPETVGLLYASSVDRETKMFGDHGLTIYAGAETKIQKHIRDAHDAVRASADAARVGMKFSELYTKTMHIFSDRRKVIKWMSTVNDIRQTNLGHTVPGSFEGDALPSGTFEEIKQKITKGRIFINEVADFTIPETCAFTVEARLADVDDAELPNAFFHFTVTFSEGEKEICSNFDGIFKEFKMNYML